MMGRKKLATSITTLMTTLAIAGCNGGSAAEDAELPVSSTPISSSNDTPNQDSANGSPENEVPFVGDAIAAALANGNPALLPAQAGLVEQRILDELTQTNAELASFFELVYGDTPIKYEPNRNSSFIFSEGLTSSYPLIIGNRGESLAAATEKNGQRSAAFGSNILRHFNEMRNLDYQPAMLNLLPWLLSSQAPELQQEMSVRFSLVDSTTFNRSKSWLLDEYPNWDIALCSDPDEFSACLSNDVDLIVTGTNPGQISEEQVVNAFDKIHQNKTPLLYVHLHSWNTGELAKTVMPYLGFYMQSPGSAGNYFSQDSAQWNSYEDMLSQHSKTAGIETLIEKFQNNSFDINLANCESGSCPAVPEMASQFAKGANAIKNIVRAFDNESRDIFKEEGFVLEKLMILLGDQYRQSIRYPMSKSSTDTGTFLRAYYADHSVYNTREHNPVQADLGNFSRADFSHITPVSTTQQYIAEPHFRSAGVYALPGQTMRVTRLDNNPVSTKVFVNSLRSSSTHEFDDNKYHRPKFLQSAKMEVKPGETIYLTSPYGGPVHIAYGAKDLEVSFRFENVGEHPHWSGPEDDARFDAALERGDFDWAEIVTSGFEVHSILDKMRNTIENWGTGSNVALATVQYVSNYPHVLAGFQGPGVDIELEVHDFAEAKGWTVPTIDIVKHMNADQATCGSGCSGNPYDAYWAFNPTGHGDLHELGHGLEKSRFKFNGQPGPTHTNFYSYYSKSKAMLEIGDTGTCQNLGFSDLLSMLQQSEQEADAFAYMQSQDSLKTSWNHGATMMIQLAAVAQNQGSLTNGWHIIPRLHLLEREYNDARKTDEKWLAQKDNLSFASYSKSEAGSLSNNDWLLIAVSLVTDIDFSDYFDMWGREVSTKAKDQVASMNYAQSATRKFYMPEQSNGYCPSLNMPTVAIIN